MVITGIPSFEQLDFTARSWLNLSWEMTIKEVKVFNEVADCAYLEEGYETQRERALEVAWENASFRLNNALSILQQGLEIALKARIARVSPFLLIAGDPQSWSRVDTSGNVDFSDLRTIDATHLIKAANAVSDLKLQSEFSSLYERLRKNRNKIQHLDGRVIQNEGSSLLMDIMSCQRYLYQNETWSTFRRSHLEAEDAATLVAVQLDSYARSIWMSEIREAFKVLDDAAIETYFHCDASQETQSCPSCLESRSEFDEDDCCFVQIRKDGTLRRIACEACFTKEEYDDAIENGFGSEL